MMGTADFSPGGTEPTWKDVAGRYGRLLGFDISGAGPRGELGEKMRRMIPPASRIVARAKLGAAVGIVGSSIRNATLIAGAPGSITPAFSDDNEGTFYLFAGDLLQESWQGKQWTKSGLRDVTKVTSPMQDTAMVWDPSPSDGPAANESRGFGHSLAVSGDYFVAGRHSQADAFVFSVSRALEHNSTLQQANPPTTPGDLFRVTPYGVKKSSGFGWSVALAGDTLVVGAPFEWKEEKKDKAGAAYVFELAYPFKHKSCPWKPKKASKPNNQTTSDDKKVLVCWDGTSCRPDDDDEKEGWSCCNAHGGRARCPLVRTLCADDCDCARQKIGCDENGRNCEGVVTTDHCCMKWKDDGAGGCAKKGGLLGCRDAERGKIDECPQELKALSDLGDVVCGADGC